MNVGVAQRRESDRVLQTHVPWPYDAAMVEIPDAKLVHQTPPRDYPDDEAVPFREANSQLAPLRGFAHQFDWSAEEVDSGDPMPKGSCGVGGRSRFGVEERGPF
jgi:hypothetical protein